MRLLAHSPARHGPASEALAVGGDEVDGSSVQAALAVASLRVDKRFELVDQVQQREPITADAEMNMGNAFDYSRIRSEDDVYLAAARKAVAWWRIW